VHPPDFCYNIGKMLLLDVCSVKYGIWNVAEPKANAVNALVGSGYAPLTAMVLASRGIQSGAQAKAYLDCNVPQTFAYAFHTMKFYVTTTFDSLKMLVTGQLSKDDVAGPVGIVKVVDETYDYYKGYGVSEVVLSMINIALLLSVNLGIMNLLPLPALDGGRLVFLLIEAVRGKPIPPEKEGMVHLAGMMALMVLMVLILFNDITKFF